MESESERTLRIIEFWKKAYDATNKNKNNNARRFSIYDIGSIDFKNDNDNDRLPYEPTAVFIKSASKSIKKVFDLRLDLNQACVACGNNIVVNYIFVRILILCKRISQNDEDTR